MLVLSSNARIRNPEGGGVLAYSGGVPGEVRRGRGLPRGGEGAAAAGRAPPAGDQEAAEGRAGKAAVREAGCSGSPRVLIYFPSLMTQEGRPVLSTTGVSFQHLEGTCRLTGVKLLIIARDTQHVFVGVPDFRAARKACFPKAAQYPCWPQH